MEIGIVSAQFLIWEYLFLLLRIFVSNFCYCFFEVRLSSVLTVGYWVSLTVVVVGSLLSGVGLLGAGCCLSGVLLSGTCFVCRVHLLMVPSYILLVVECWLSSACITVDKWVSLSAVVGCRLSDAGCRCLPVSVVTHFFPLLEPSSAEM